MERGKHKLELIKELGEFTHNGRTYKVAVERIVDTGDEYPSIRLYNKDGKFIKRFMIDKEVCGDIGQLLVNYSLYIPIAELERRFPHLFRDEKVPS